MGFGEERLEMVAAFAPVSPSAHVSSPEGTKGACYGRVPDEILH